jgi:hypothetical protein
MAHVRIFVHVCKMTTASCGLLLSDGLWFLGRLLGFWLSAVSTLAVGISFAQAHTNRLIGVVPFFIALLSG